MISVQSQEKKIGFTKQLQYSFNKVEGDRSTFDGSLKTLINTNGESLSFINMGAVPLQLFTDALGSTPVTISLNSKLQYSDFAMYYLGGMQGKSNTTTKIPAIEKLKTSEKILGINCTNYLITPKNEEYSGSQAIKICLDEKNSYNNVNLLSGIYGLFSQHNINLSSLKGLILKAAPEDEYDKSYLVLQKIQDNTDFVYFDHKQVMLQHQKKMDSLLLEQEKYEKEYAEKYPFVETEIDTAYAATDSAKVGSSYEYDEEFIPEYQSFYKTINEEPNLAIDNIPSEKLWKSLPNHCRNLNKNLPDLNNKEFLNHLKNYTGQICDMYLTQNQNHNVAIKATLDEIRKEVLYFNEKKEKLNKSDQKKVNQYLENLD